MEAVATAPPSPTPKLSSNISAAWDTEFLLPSSYTVQYITAQRDGKNRAKACTMEAGRN
jgi:hypothetical protein